MHSFMMIESYYLSAIVSNRPIVIHRGDKKKRHPANWVPGSGRFGSRSAGWRECFKARGSGDRHGRAVFHPTRPNIV